MTEHFAKAWVNLADERLHARVLSANDEFFAEKENLIKPGRGIFIPDKYTPQGKWMDGWETRRRREPGHDSCVVKLGLSGVIRGIDIDTNHFLGNHPEQASVDACCVASDPNQQAVWKEILEKSPLQPDSQNLFDIKDDGRWTHVRLNIYPDGGVARLRIYGEVAVNFVELKKKDLVDLVAIENGGRVVSCNDMFFSSKDNLIMPGRGVNMGDGWETRRRRGPGHDWVVLRLGARGVVKKIVVDTAHFKGNYPDSCLIDGVALEREVNFHETEVNWQTLLPQTKLKADCEHVFEKEVRELKPVSHVRLNIYPDGGVSRFRLYGVLL